MLHKVVRSFPVNLVDCRTWAGPDEWFSFLGGIGGQVDKWVDTKWGMISVTMLKGWECIVSSTLLEGILWTHTLPCILVRWICGCSMEAKHPAKIVVWGLWAGL